MRRMINISKIKKTFEKNMQASKIDFDSEETRSLLMPQDVITLQHKYEEIKASTQIIKLSKLKEIGIEPAGLTPALIKLSFSQSNRIDDMKEIFIDKDEDEVEDLLGEESDEEKIVPWQEYIIISHDNRLYSAWLVLETLIQIGSSYIYAYYATFNYNGKYQENLDVFMMIFESFFFISMLLKFLVEFKPDGSTIYVRDLVEIANRYLNG